MHRFARRFSLKSITGGTKTSAMLHGNHYFSKKRAPCCMGAVLGCSWGGLGASWAPLGPSWRRSKITQKLYAREERFQTRIRPVPSLFWGSFLGPKIDQNRTQNESKFKTIFKSEKVGRQEPLGAVLGRSWDILEAILGSQFALRY